MSRQFRNGGILGPRNLPNNKTAGGVWSIEDAYFASREAQWPAWPQDVGIPYKSDLLVWLEADYGVWSDAGMTTKAVSGGPVEAWENRGRLGPIYRDQMGAAWTLTPETLTNGLPTINMQSAGLSRVQAVDSIKSNNYWFLVHHRNAAATNRFFTVHNQGTEIVADTSVPRVELRSSSAGQVQYPVSNSANGSLTSSWDATWGHNSRISFAYAASAAPSALEGNPTGPLPNLAAAGFFLAQNTPSAFAWRNDLVPAGVNYPQALRLAGVRTGASTVGTASGRLQAALWFSLDHPMTFSELNAVATYLGNKYGFR